MSDYLYNGKQFASYDEFVVCMKDLQEATGFKYSCSRSHTLKSRKRDFPNAEKLKYATNKFSCKRGGNYVPKGKGIRNKSSKKMGCPAGFTYSTPHHGLWAEAVNVCLDHTCGTQHHQAETKTKESVRSTGVDFKTEIRKNSVDDVQDSDESLGAVEHGSSAKLQEEKNAVGGQDESIINDEACGEAQFSLQDSACDLANVSSTLEHLSIEENFENSHGKRRGSMCKDLQEDDDYSETDKKDQVDTQYPAERQDRGHPLDSTTIVIDADQQQAEAMSLGNPIKAVNRKGRIYRVLQGDNDDSETDNEINLANVKYREKTRSRGRPRGTTQTAIGLDRQPTHAMPFEKKSDPRKCSQLLKSMVTEPVLKLVLRTEYKLKTKDLPGSVELLSDIFMDENVDLKLLKAYLLPDAFKYLKQLVAEKKRNDYFTCPVCNCRVQDASVGCNDCLLWYHFGCVGLTRGPKTKFWYCQPCQGSQ